MSHESLLKVLIIDDQVAVRELSAFALEGTGRYSVIQSTNATDALELMDRQRFDCMVLDLDMPDMTGNELLSIIRRREQKDVPPIVLVTPAGVHPGDSELDGVRVDGYVMKPFEPWDLCGLVDTLTGALKEAAGVLSVDAVLRGFPYPTMILDAGHTVLLANSPFYRETGSGIGDRFIYCAETLHEGGKVPGECPLDEAVRTGHNAERTVDTLLGRMRVSVYPLAVQGPDGRALYLHVTQPTDVIVEPQRPSAGVASSQYIP